jgi:hypothetical protein
MIFNKVFAPPAEINYKLLLAAPGKTAPQNTGDAANKTQDEAGDEPILA